MCKFLSSCVIDQKLTMFETLAHACTNAHCIGRYLAFLALIVCFLIKSRFNFCKMPNIQLFSEIVGRVVGNQSRTRFIGSVAGGQFHRSNNLVRTRFLLL